MGSLGGGHPIPRVIGSRGSYVEPGGKGYPGSIGRSATNVGKTDPYLVARYASRAPGRKGNHLQLKSALGSTGIRRIGKEGTDFPTHPIDQAVVPGLE